MTAPDDLARRLTEASRKWHDGRDTAEMGRAFVEIEAVAHEAIATLRRQADALDPAKREGMDPWWEQAALWHDDQYAQARDDVAKFSEAQDYGAMRGASSWGNFCQTSAIMLRRHGAALAAQAGESK